MKTRRDLFDEFDTFTQSVRTLIEGRDVDPHEFTRGIPTELLVESEQLASEIAAVAFHFHARVRRLARAIESSALAHTGRAVHRPGREPNDGADG